MHALVHMVKEMPGVSPPGSILYIMMQLKPTKLSVTLSKTWLLSVLNMIPMVPKILKIYSTVWLQH